MHKEKRDVQALRTPLFPIAILLLFLLICINPASADESGTFESANVFIQHENHYGMDVGGGIPLDAIYFQQIDALTQFKAVKLYTTTFYAHQLNGSTYAFQTDAATLRAPDGSIVSTGIYGYQVAGSDVYIYYFANTWTPGTLIGPVKLNLTWHAENFNFESHETSLFARTSTTPGTYGINYNVVFASSVSNTHFVYDGTDNQYVTEVDSYFRTDYKLTRYSGYDKLGITRVFGIDKYYSRVTINQTNPAGSGNITVVQNTSAGDISINYLTGWPLYLEVWDILNGVNYTKIFSGTYNMGIQLSKGATSSNPANVDSSITATVIGTNGIGFKYFLWRWSENWDTFLPMTSLKTRMDSYKTYQFNSTNASSGGNWELYASGFENKGVVTASTARGVYTWNQVKTQQVRFNWSSTDQSWTQSSTLSTPYNYVTANVYDENSNILGSATANVYVIKAADVGQFYIFVIDPTGLTKVYDSNVFVFDTEANPGVWVVNNVNATYGSYIVDVNVSHAHYVWAKAPGYWFVSGKDLLTGITQVPVNGCVTFSIPFTGIKQIELTMQKVSATNNSAIFTVESQSSDLTSPKTRVPNAKITITSHQSSDIIYTDGTGIARFDMVSTPVIVYNYKVEYDRGGCYQKAESWFNSAGHQGIYVLLDSCSYITIQPTITPTTLTPVPTVTVLPGPGEPGGDVISSFIRLFQMAGAGTVSNAKLMLALVICSALAFIFGYYLSFQASLIGAFIGFVFSLAFGLIPMWILIALIIIGGVLFAGKWWSGSGGG